MPETAQEHTELGQQALQSKQYVEAEGHFRRAIASEPENAESHRNLGEALMMKGDLSAATLEFRTALKLEGKDSKAHILLGRTLFARRKTDEAIEHYRKALELDPSSAEAHVHLARALAKALFGTEAMSHLQEAAKLDPSNADAHQMLAYCYQETGQFNEAIKCFEKVIELKPESGAAYYGITISKKITKADYPLLDKIEELAGKAEKQTDERDLNYALAKGRNDLGDYQAAMGHYERAHFLAAKNLGAQPPFDKAGFAAHIELMIKTFTPSFFERWKGYENESDLPILFVGLPRSGTTLLEQILTCHPDIGDGGELLYWSEHGIRAFREFMGGTPNREIVSEVGASYLEVLGRIAPGKRFVSDKMPNNFLYLGLIHILFPNARFLHCRRHPVDNLLSLYTTPSRNPGPMVHSKETLVFVYQNYARLMDHWRSVLPESCMFEVSYESIVSDLEGTTRSVLSYLGLPWNDACLHPEQNPRAVSTPSQWQVRQPIYSGSVERWRRYEPWLGPLRDLLEK